MNEFEIISKYLKPLSLSNISALKLSDDIFFDKNKGLAITIDTYVEGVHFLDSSNPNKFLKKILRSSLSDLYCKGIAPKSFFLSLALKKNLANDSWLRKVKNILSKEQKKFKIFISGGDITTASKLVITAIILGYSKSNPVLRRGSKVNDDIYVTGNIGDSYIGLSILKKKFNFGKFNNFFKKKYYEPELQVKFSPHLKKVASSSIDISDGLAQDLRHLCSNSKHGAIVNLNQLPLSYKTEYLIKNKKIYLNEIFSKGDDYQILFTAQPNNRSKVVALSKKTNTKISRIGRIKKDNKIIFKYNDKILSFYSKKMGYTHSF